MKEGGPRAGSIVSQKFRILICIDAERFSGMRLTTIQLA